MLTLSQRDEAQGGSREEDPETQVFNESRAVIGRLAVNSDQEEVWCSWIVHCSWRQRVLKAKKDLMSGLEIVWGSKNNSGYTSVGGIWERK